MMRVTLYELIRVTLYELMRVTLYEWMRVALYEWTRVRLGKLDYMSIVKNPIAFAVIFGMER